MKDKISVIFQNSDNKITGFLEEDISKNKVEESLDAGLNVLIDCDEDAFIIESTDLPLSLTILDEKNMPESKLIPVIAMNTAGRILMFAFASNEALKLTLKEGFGYYYSRSRDKLWKKGEESGHVQKIEEVLFSAENHFCIYIIQQNVAACHTGYESCFYRKLEKNGDKIVIFKDKKFDPDSVYKG